MDKSVVITGILAGCAVVCLAIFKGADPVKLIETIVTAGGTLLGIHAGGKLALKDPKGGA